MEQKGNRREPKIGRTFEVKNNFDNIGFTCETVDKVNFKSVMLFMNAWFIMTSDVKPKRKIEKLLEQIKCLIKTNTNKHYFNGMMIDVAEIPFTFDNQKSGYITFEYTLFVNKGVIFDKKEITMVMNDLIQKIYDEFFKETIDFDCYKERRDFNTRLNWIKDNEVQSN